MQKIMILIFIFSIFSIKGNDLNRLNNLLIEAAKECDLKEIKKLLVLGADMNSKASVAPSTFKACVLEHICLNAYKNTNEDDVLKTIAMLISKGVLIENIFLPSRGLIGGSDHIWNIYVSNNIDDIIRSFYNFIISIKIINKEMTPNKVAEAFYNIRNIFSSSEFNYYEYQVISSFKHLFQKGYGNLALEFLDKRPDLLLQIPTNIRDAIKKLIDLKQKIKTLNFYDKDLEDFVLDENVINSIDSLEVSQHYKCLIYQLKELQKLKQDYTLSKDIVFNISQFIFLYKSAKS